MPRYCETFFLKNKSDISPIVYINTYKTISHKANKTKS